MYSCQRSSQNYRHDFYIQVVNHTKVTYTAPQNGLSYTGLVVDSFPFVTGSNGKGFVTQVCLHIFIAVGSTLSGEIAQWCFKVKFADNSITRWYRSSVSLASAE